ncbi:rust resistance kinase Lr10-like [Olea europaea subsp. europaea]|uniref:Rust resistance kinase Lr10-like n=1 Tax=Olea europaea subsp. europaea TaxID=158383 RepID=A0A8S0PUN0_OLEEU|nr:rust resistance kinase Lr10-like [Olea europaea subsp. europaea]
MMLSGDQIDLKWILVDSSGLSIGSIFKNTNPVEIKSASLRASLSMRNIKLLFAISMVFLILLHCATYCEADCHPTSCGSITNISYPFRLTGDPENCGDSSYELACENNQTILYLSFGRFFVQSISYNNYSIRLLDAGMEKNSCDSFPKNRVPLSHDYRFTPYDLVSNDNTMIIDIHCEAPAESPFYVHTCICSKNISLQKYSYFVVGNYVRVADLNDSCRIDWMAECRAKNGHCYIEDGTIGCNHPSCRYWDPYEFHIPSHNCSSHLWLQFLAEYHTKLFHILGWILAARFSCGILFLLTLLAYKIRRRHLSIYDNIEEFLQIQKNFKPIRYSYRDLKNMTKNFKDKLGEGGYGTVFKGRLRSGPFVAIKLMGKSKASGHEFISEVATIGRIHHVNVVRLVGFCVEGSKRALIYEFMPNGSLEKYIFPREVTVFLSYGKIFEIALGVAKGIDYLHQGCDMQILHFDIKPHNILLDHNFIPKISDFGLAKLYPADENLVSLTAARGTMGYMAPEMFYRNIGRVSYKSDVYSFGMLLMEMASKRRNLNPVAENISQIYFPCWVHDTFSKGMEIDLGDASLDERIMVKKMTLVALWCIQMKPDDRPSMNKVIEMLEGDVELLQLPPKPFLSPEEMPDSDIDLNDMDFPLLSGSFD